MNRGLYTLVIEANNRWRKRDGGRRGDKGLIMVETYTQVENSLGMHLRYAQIICECPMLPDMEKILGPAE